jgi:Predicted GTPase
METKKILVLGESDSGKRTALNHVCSNLVETKAASYGKTTINNKKLQIFSPSSALRFNFMKDILSKNVDGAIIVIDNTQGITPSCEEMIDFVEEKCVPYIIFANKQDLSNTPIYTQYPDVIIIPTEAISGKGISEGIISLLELMEPGIHP